MRMILLLVINLLKHYASIFVGMVLCDLNMQKFALEEVQLDIFSSFQDWEDDELDVKKQKINFNIAAKSIV